MLNSKYSTEAGGARRVNIHKDEGASASGGREGGKEGGRESRRGDRS